MYNTMYDKHWQRKRTTRRRFWLLLALALPVTYGLVHYVYPTTPGRQEVWVQDARTGDSVWGISIRGVIPIPALLGGGHLVLLSAKDSEYTYAFHLHGKRTVQFQDIRFELEVADSDAVRVNRQIQQVSTYRSVRP